MDETDEPAASNPATVGARLRAAREARGQSLEEIGKQTRVPVRHLVQIEEGRLEGLPAAPYSAGFVKAYARAVDLDPVGLSQEFRAELAQTAHITPRIAYEPYEPADPTRLPPRLLAIVALVIAVLLIAGYALWRSGVLTGAGADERARLAANVEPGAAPDAGNAPAAPAPHPAAAISNGPVRLTATQDTWFEVTDKTAGTRLYTGVLKQGQSWDVPAGAGDPVIRTGRPEGITVTVGGQAVAPLGAPAHTISNVSLKADALRARGPGGGPPPGTTVRPGAQAPAAPADAASDATAAPADQAAVPPAFRNAQ